MKVERKMRHTQLKHNFGVGDEGAHTHTMQQEITYATLNLKKMGSNT